MLPLRARLLSLAFLAQVGLGGSSFGAREGLKYTLSEATGHGQGDGAWCQWNTDCRGPRLCDKYNKGASVCVSCGTCLKSRQTCSRQVYARCRAEANLREYKRRSEMLMKRKRKKFKPKSKLMQLAL